MSGARVALLGDPGDLALAGAEGRFDWGEVVLGPADGALTIALVRDAAATSPSLTWDAAAATVLRADGSAWRRLPWPAGVRAAALAEPPDGRALIAGPAEATDPIAERLLERGVAVDRRAAVDLEALGAASVVCLPSPDGAPPPAEAMAVLAAGRVLVTGRCAPRFGLQPGIDCYMESTPDAAAQRVEAAVRWPLAFRVTAAMGRVAAAPYRADVLLHRLAVDAALGVS
jgi:hypothetical protein